MTGKKKCLIIVGLVIFILCAAAAGTYIWYINSPFPTVVNLVRAAGNKDVDGMLDCIEPDKANVIRGLFAFMGMDPGELMDRLMPENEGLLSLKSDISGIRFSGYHRDGDEAYIELKITGEEKDRADTRKIYFVRVDGKWYLKLSFSRGMVSDMLTCRLEKEDIILCCR